MSPGIYSFSTKKFRVDRHERSDNNRETSSGVTSVVSSRSCVDPQGVTPLGKVTGLPWRWVSYSWVVFSDRQDGRLEVLVLPVWSGLSPCRSVSVSVPPLQYKYHILHTGTERSPGSCSQIFILKLIYHIYSYYCNVVCFSDVGLQPGNRFIDSMILWFYYQVGRIYSQY